MGRLVCGYIAAKRRWLWEVKQVMDRKKSPSGPVLDKRTGAIGAGFKTYAAQDTFKGITEPVYAAKRASVAHGRDRLKDALVEVERARIELQRDELELWDMSGDVVDGVIGDARFGRNSALYGSFGLVRPSQRKSGLTRKGDAPVYAPKARGTSAVALPTLPLLKPLEPSGSNGNGNH